MEEMLRIAEAATQGPTAMPGEQRVTDEDLVNWSKPATDLDIAAPLRTLALIAAVRDERTAHRATEAKLREALAEVERLKADIDRRRLLANEDGVTIQTAWKRATAAESALAATKAKLEAAEKALREAAKDLKLAMLAFVFTDPGRSNYFARAHENAAALTTKETTDAN